MPEQDHQQNPPDIKKHIAHYPVLRGINWLLELTDNEQITLPANPFLAFNQSVAAELNQRLSGNTRYE